MLLCNQHPGLEFGCYQNSCVTEFYLLVCVCVCVCVCCLLSQELILLVFMSFLLLGVSEISLSSNL